MRKYIFLLFSGVLIPFITTAQTYNYVPSTINLPTLTGKKQGNVAIGWGRGYFFQSFEALANYSPVKHLAISASYFGDRSKSVRQEQEDGSDYYQWNVAVSAYEAINKGAASLTVGMGNGHLFNYYGLARTAEFNLQNIYVQPGIAYRSNHFYAGLALRMSYLNYRNGAIDYSIEESSLRYILNIEKDAPMFLPEIGLQAGLYIKPIVLSLNLASVFPSTDLYDFGRLNTALVLSYEFGPR